MHNVVKHSLLAAFNIAGVVTIPLRIKPSPSNACMNALLVTLYLTLLALQYLESLSSLYASAAEYLKQF